MNEGRKGCLARQPCPSLSHYVQPATRLGHMLPPIPVFLRKRRLAHLPGANPVH
jgi:hypothetical protein